MFERVKFFFSGLSCNGLQPWYCIESLHDIGCHAACPVGINSGA